MTAKEMFEKLNYKQTENSPDDGTPKEIQYTLKDDNSEMQRIGRVSTKKIEFYSGTKELLMVEYFKNRKGVVSKSDIVLSFEEFQAIQKQIAELNW